MSAPAPAPVAARPVPRRPAAVALVVLLLALAAALALVVPWTTLSGAQPVVDVGRDFTPEQVARAEAYGARVRPWSYLSLALGLVVAAVLALTPLGARVVRGVARPLGGGWVWQVLLGTVALTAIGRLVTLPLAAHVETGRRDFGLSTRTWDVWALDVAKGVGVSSAMTGLGVLAVVALARAAPRTWWAWGSAVVASLVVAGSFAYPVVVEPVFNEFTPLPAGELRDDLLALAEQDGVPVGRVLVADASRRTSALNAYVSGLGSTRRIVLYDTLLQQATPAEVRLVVAHELAHAKHRDVVKGTLMGALGAAAGVCALFLLLSWRPLVRRGGSTGAADPRVVPLLLLLVAVAELASAPGVNLVSRKVEARADVSSLALTGDVPTFVETHRRLALTNLATLEPNPVAYAFFASHPSTAQRIALAREWERLQGGGR